MDRDWPKGSRPVDAAKTSSPTRRIAPKAMPSSGKSPGGIVWLFYVIRYGETWSTRSSNTSSPRTTPKRGPIPTCSRSKKGSMVAVGPIVLTNGDYLLPVYHETGEDRERTAQDTCSFFFRYSRQTKAWTESNRISSANGNLQPAAVQITDDYLVAYCRPGGDFEPNPNRFIIRSESHDGGRTWSKGENSAFPNPNSAVDFIKLQNGHLLLVYNDTNIGDRMPLTVAISTDHGKTWPHRRNIVNIPGDTAAYPYVIETADGRLHGVYTSQERTVINHFVMDEDDIVEGIGR